MPANLDGNDIVGASFYAAPDGTLAPGGNASEPFFEEFGFTEMEISVHAVEDGAWIAEVAAEGSLTAWPPMAGAASPLAGDDGYLIKGEGLESIATGWDVTAAVQDWYLTPADNFGLGLRIAQRRGHSYRAGRRLAGRSGPWRR